MGVLQDIYESGMFHPLKIETDEYKSDIEIQDIRKNKKMHFGLAYVGKK